MFTQRPIHQHGWKLPKACYIVYFNHRFLKENYLACVSEASSMSTKSKKFIQWAKWWHKHVLCIFIYHWWQWRDKAKPTVGWKGSTVNTATNTHKLPPSTNRFPLGSHIVPKPIRFNTIRIHSLNEFFKGFHVYRLISEVQGERAEREREIEPIHPLNTHTRYNIPSSDSWIFKINAPTWETYLHDYSYTVGSLAYHV